MGIKSSRSLPVGSTQGSTSPSSPLDGVAALLLNLGMGPGPHLGAGRSGRQRGLLVDPGRVDCTPGNGAPTPSPQPPR